MLSCPVVLRLQGDICPGNTVPIWRQDRTEAVAKLMNTLGAFARTKVDCQADLQVCIVLTMASPLFPVTLTTTKLLHKHPCNMCRRALVTSVSKYLLTIIQSSIDSIATTRLLRSLD
jgi:hypothetical protein